MSLTLSVTSSSTLFATNIPANAGTLTFASSTDSITYTTLSSVPASPISIPAGTTTYSLTFPLVPNQYYRVTTGSGGSAVTQYIVTTQGTTGSSTSTFSNAGTGSATIGSTTVTMNQNSNAVLSDQTYAATQGVYFQLNTPIGTTMGNGNYTMSILSGTFDNAQSGGSSTSAYFRVTTTGTSTSVGLFRRDNGTETQIGTNTTITGNPTSLALFWDGVNTVFFYIGGVLISSYTFLATWTTVRTAIQVATLTTPYTLTDVRLYQTGRIPTSQTWRLNIQAVTGTSLTSLTSPALSVSTYGTYYNITNSGFANLSLPNITDTGASGAFWVLRNNTTSYLSVSLAGTITGLTSPLVFPPTNSVTIVWNGTGYVLF